MSRLHLNENPHVGQAYARYPEASYEELRRLLRERHGLVQANVLAGAGSTELIAAIFLWAHLNRKKIVFPWPSYILYQELQTVYRADVVRIPVGLEAWDTELIRQAVPEDSLLILCNPNNPTGTYLPKAAMRELIAKLPSSVTVLVDEAYMEYVAEEAETTGLVRDVETNPQLIVVRTFSKYYGLAGLRVGYAVVSQQWFATLRRFLQLWNVSVPAVEAAVECVADGERFAAGKRAMLALRERVVRALEEQGFRVLPSQTNFLCLTHPQIEQHVARWEADGMVVNRLSPYAGSELEGYVRLSIEQAEVMERLLHICETTGGHDETNANHVVAI